MAAGVFQQSEHAGHLRKSALLNPVNKSVSSVQSFLNKGKGSLDAQALAPVIDVECAVPEIPFTRRASGCVYGTGDRMPGAVFFHKWLELPVGQITQVCGYIRIRIY